MSKFKDMLRGLKGKNKVIEDNVDNNANEKPIETKKKALISDDVKGCFKWFMPILTSVFICILAISIINRMRGERLDAIVSLENRIIDTNDTITIKQNEYADMIVIDNKTRDDIVFADEKVDNSAIISFFKEYVTWYSGTDYENVRDKALDEDLSSSLMAVLLPQQAFYEDRSTGIWHYQLDYEGLSSTFEDFYGYKLNVSDSYAGVLKVAIFNSKTSTEVIKSIYVTYTLDNDIISDVECYLLEG